MNAREYIVSKQIQWALNRGIKLKGSKGRRGRRTYTPTLEQNLFEPLKTAVRDCFERGDGTEINSIHGNPAKMQAVHSSSALGVNVFQYWLRKKHVPVIAAACGFCRRGVNASKDIVFEKKYPIDDRFRFAPNIDVVIHNSPASRFKVFAVECKFAEAYNSRGHTGLKQKYLKLGMIWDDIPALRGLAKSLCPDDKRFRHLHAAQLIKHMLGLKKEFAKDRFRLLYLWYDVLGEEGCIHRKEIEAFTVVARSDGIKFHSLSYQELIVRLAKECGPEHEEYIRYITDRYL